MLLLTAAAGKSQRFISSVSSHPHDPSAAPPGGLRWSAQTDRGRVRENNEDSFLALSFNAEGVRRLGKYGEASQAGADFVFAVSDGMGGARSGEFASRIAVDQITRLLPRSFRQGASGLAAGFGDVLGEIFSRTHAEITRLGESYDECLGMGATLTLAWIVPGWLYFGHVGDSRLYYLPKGGEMKQISHDDSHVGWLARSGQLNERQFRTHPRRNVLNKALGAGHRYVEPQIGAVGCEPGDRFLLCTDGVMDGLWNHALADLLAGGEPFDTLAARLVAEAVAESGRDNTTALIVEIMPPNSPHPGSPRAS